MASIKVKFQNDIRRVTLPEPISFSKLKEVLRILYRTSLPRDFTVKYVDDEGDHISITSDIELEEACSFVKRTGAPVMRMFITATDDHQPPRNATREEKTSILRDFDHSTQQTAIVTQSQLISIEQIMKAKANEESKGSTEKSQSQAQTQAQPQPQPEPEPEPQSQPQPQLQPLRQEPTTPVENPVENSAETQAPPFHQPTLLIPTPAPQLFPETQQPASTSETQSPTESARNYTAVFVEDVGIQDGHVLPPKTQFTKVWRMRNTGTQPWPAGTQLVFRLGDSMGTESFPITQIAGPGEEVDIAASLRSPSNPGRFIAYYRLLSPDGLHFGHRIWADIVVDDALPQKAEQGEVAPPSMEVTPAPAPAPAPAPTPAPVPAPAPAPPAQQPETTSNSPFSAEFEGMIETMVSLGFQDRNVNAEALLRAQGSVEAAINLLLDS